MEGNYFNPPAENRPKYRAGRKPTAVKVYTINQESRYLVVENVPSIGLKKELIELCALYGTVEEYRHLDDYPCEEFTEVYWVKFQSLAESSSPLRVRYAPEYETVQDTRDKLFERRQVVAIKTGEHKPQQLGEGSFTTYAPPLPLSLPSSTNYSQSNLSLNYSTTYMPPQHSTYTIYQTKEPPIPGVGYPANYPPMVIPPPSSAISFIHEQIKKSTFNSSISQVDQTNSESTVSSLKTTDPSKQPKKRRRI
ncbi:hypothetical protein G9A89_003139 [Geosiphon pyriformis]|nr:hypothetical protein G9A89_003139 [Geosiphon pyriformis]